jgi:hypothetical protein
MALEHRAKNRVCIVIVYLVICSNRLAQWGGIAKHEWSMFSLNSES